MKLTKQQKRRQRLAAKQREEAHYLNLINRVRRCVKLTAAADTAAETAERDYTMSRANQDLHAWLDKKKA